MNFEILEMLRKISHDTVADEPMKNHTSFKIGGPADYFTEPDNVEQIGQIIEFCKNEKLPCFIMGNGSNLLVSDKGIEGVVVNIGDKFSGVEIDGKRVFAGAGILISRFSKILLENELSGLECGSGIPGTLGGGIYMNAGAYGFEMKNVVKSVTYADENGEIKKASGEELDFGYRKSMFTGRNCVIILAEMEFEKGNKEDIKKLMAECTAKRVDKQPLSMPSAGSVFKRPEGNFAGTLIEQAGLKGYSIGGAQVSEKHAGFIVNTGGATADDVLKLIDYIIKTVEEKFEVTLEPEIRLIGRI